MNPYRDNKVETKIISKQAPKLRTLYRRFIIWIYGSFKKRFPDKCHICNKKSHDMCLNAYKGNRYTVYSSLNYYDCGHRRNSPWQVWQ